MSWATAGEWWLRSAAGGGLLLLLAWVFTRRTGQPARRQRLGETAVAAALLLTILSLGPSWLVLPVSFTEKVPAPVETASQQRSSVAEESPRVADIGQPWPGAADVAASGMMPPSEWEADPAPVPASPPATVEPPPPVAVSAAPVASSLSTIRIGLGIAYVAGAALLLGRWLLGWLVLQRLLHVAEPAPEPVARLFAVMAPNRLRARLLVSHRLRVPFSCGLFRPTVVLPMVLCEPTAARTLRWVFAHELTHLERRDTRVCLLFALGQVLYYYLPWFWWLRRQVRLCQEYIADAAAAAVAPAEDYAQFLLNLTEAPAVPAGALGVLGSSSDLFWRVTMLLQDPSRVEKQCSRRWSLATAGGLLAVAVLVSGLGLSARAVPAPEDPPKKDEPKKVEDKKAEPAKSEPKKDEPRKDPAVPGLPDLDTLPKNPPAGIDAEQWKLLRKQMEMANAAMMRAMQGNQLQFQPAVPGFPGQEHQSRLGVRVDRPSPTLVEQLDLPKGQGLAVEQVMPDSAAAKAGLRRKTDILLELNGKAVPSDAHEFAKQLEDVKPNTPVDVVVLRKGKKETVKGLSLPEAKSEAPAFPTINLQVPALPAAPALVPQALPGAGFAIPGFAGNGVMTSTFRTDDRFTTRHQEGSLVITVTGKVADGKATVNEIKVQDGIESHSYESVDKVAGPYRDKVKNLVEMSEKGAVKVEIKKD